MFQPNVFAAFAFAAAVILLFVSTFKNERKRILPEALGAILLVACILLLIYAGHTNGTIYSKLGQGHW